jgi:hypothetical protein
VKAPSGDCQILTGALRCAWEQFAAELIIRGAESRRAT